MARFRTTPVQEIGPLVSLTCGANYWQAGTAVEVIGSAASNLQIAGMALELGGTVAGMRYIIEVCTGAVGAETAVWRWYFEFGNPGNKGPHHYLAPIPSSVIPAGSRVSLRFLSNGQSVTITAGLLRYASLDSIHLVDAGLEHYPEPVLGVSDATPANGRAALTPSATPWTNSAWVRVSPVGGWDEAVLLAHLNIDALPSGADWEADIGLGAAPVLATTEAGKPLAASNSVGLKQVAFDPPFKVEADTEVWVRLRKSDTSTSALYVSVNYYGGVFRQPPPMQRAGYLLFSQSIVERQVETRLTKTYLQLLAADPPAAAPPAVLGLIQITGTLKDQVGGSITSGQLRITPRGTITAGTELIAPQTVLYTVTGAINLNLAPSNGTLYDVQFDPDPADTSTPINLKPGYWSDVWDVPSSGPVDIATL